MLPCILTEDQMTVVVNGQTYDVEKDHPRYSDLVAAVNDDDGNAFLDLVDYKQALSKYTNGKLEVVDDRVFYDGNELHGCIIDRILEMQAGGFNLDSMINFLEKLYRNPSKNSVEEAYNFLSHKKIPITPDGCFYAYKTVRVYQGEDFTDSNGRIVTKGDYVDKYSSSIRNNIGDVNTMPRNKVDDDKNRHCSQGYHVGALEYAGPNGWYNNLGDAVVLCKVSPEDMVSVPTDHSFSKLRVCKYTVESLYKSPLNKPVYGDEELEEDVEYVLESDGIPIEVDQLGYGDEIKFVYEGEVRHAMVDTSKQDILNGVDPLTFTLLDEDPSFDENRPSWRQFKLDKMSNIVYLG